MMLGTLVATGVWQIGKSDGDKSMAVAAAPSTVKTFPPSTVSSAALHSAPALTEANRLCDRVNVAMFTSKIAKIALRSAGCQDNPRTGASFGAFPTFCKMAGICDPADT